MRLRVIDIETVGLVPPEGASGIVEIGWCDVVQSRGLWGVAGGGSMLVDPECEIAPEASAVHHLIDEDVRGSLCWEDSAPLVFEPEPYAYVAHNAAFERAWCKPEVVGDRRWICTHKAALRLWRDAPSHSNQTLRYWRRPEGLDRTLAALAHRAYPDAYVTAHHVRDMLEVASVDELIAWTGQPALLVRCSFGKHRGTPWSEVPTDYLDWCSRQQMEPDVAFTVRHELDRRAA